MRKESLNIAIACFIGGVLGVFFAVKIAEMYEFGRYFWFVGAFLGGAVAYLAYDPWAVASATRRAWYELADVEHAKRFLRAAGVTVEVIFLIAVMIAGIAFTFSGGYIGYIMLDLWGEEVAAGWFGVSYLFFACTVVVTFWHINTPTPQAKQEKEVELSLHKRLMEAALFINPICFPLLLAAGTLFLLWKIACVIARRARRTPKAAWLLAVFTARFIHRVFVYIHSTERIVCLVDATLGVAVAYTLIAPTIQMMLVGGTLGLIFGVLNYEIISVRILKLVPARAKK